MIRQDRELLAELARVNSDVVPVAMRVMDDSATPEEQRELATRLIDLGQRLDRRAELTGHVIEAETVGVIEAPSVPNREQ
ncbi:MAG: hypothetical protein GEU83_13695 [Pseudonocardiaceae bacterium]|nr:hypothetical protein [Pseudonocardiaceae bacterium]